MGSVSPRAAEATTPAEAVTTDSTRWFANTLRTYVIVKSLLYLLLLGLPMLGLAVAVLTSPTSSSTGGNFWAILFGPFVLIAPVLVLLARSLWLAIGTPTRFGLTTSEFVTSRWRSETRVPLASIGSISSRNSLVFKPRAVITVHRQPPATHYAVLPELVDQLSAAVSKARAAQLAAASPRLPKAGIVRDIDGAELWTGPAASELANGEVRPDIKGDPEVGAWWSPSRDERQELAFWLVVATAVFSFFGVFGWAVNNVPDPSFDFFAAAGACAVLTLSVLALQWTALRGRIMISRILMPAGFKLRDCASICEEAIQAAGDSIATRSEGPYRLRMTSRSSSRIRVIRDEGDTVFIEARTDGREDAARRHRRLKGAILQVLDEEVAVRSGAVAKSES